MTEEITQEQREKYIQLKNEFLNKKEKINYSISECDTKIQEYKKQRNNLEGELKTLRPLIPDCDKSLICERCDIKSMKWDGYQPGQSEHINWYKCVICGHEDYCT